MTDPQHPVLEVEALSVDYRVKGRNLRILRDLSLSISPGQSYGLVGESGCGKSTAAFAMLRYLPANGSISGGRVLVNGRDIYRQSALELRELRRTSIAMVYQDPGKALNPSIRIGRQVAEVFELGGVQPSSRAGRVKDILEKVRIRDPERVMQCYPHQLSGGMQQRVAIAMALASEPSLLILDEPTTGLDATVEGDVLDLILQLRQDFSTATLFISHNLAVIAKMCERVGVLYAGELVEEGPAREVFQRPRHPYTLDLLRCLPQRGRSKRVSPLATIPGFLPAAGQRKVGCVYAARCARADDRCRQSEPETARFGNRASKCHYFDDVATIPDAANGQTAAFEDTGNRVSVLALANVTKTFGAGEARVKAVSNVSLSLEAGETLGLVGESGSGKTTLAKAILGLVAPDAGSRISMAGEAVAATLPSRTFDQVKALQIIFQNPDSALNRAHTIRRMLGRTIARLTARAPGARESRIRELTEVVRLSSLNLDLKPRQLSGGMKQRVAIARAFAGEPSIVICDEPTSALDVSVQAAILNLLVELQVKAGVSYIFISHDLGVVRYISDRIAVLYLGQIMEIGPADAVFSGPHHPYTDALLSSVPSIYGEAGDRQRLAGEIPSATELPKGCVFHTRCPRKIGAICEHQEPQVMDIDDRHQVKCHLPVDELPRSGSSSAVSGGIRGRP
jgi:peptide/nickel transport system ATP-binding protein